MSKFTVHKQASMHKVRSGWIKAAAPTGADIATFDACMKYRGTCLRLPIEDWASVIEMMLMVHPDALAVLARAYLSVGAEIIHCPPAGAPVAEGGAFDEWFALALPGRIGTYEHTERLAKAYPGLVDKYGIL